VQQIWLFVLAELCTVGLFIVDCFSGRWLCRNFGGTLILAWRILALKFWLLKFRHYHQASRWTGPLAPSASLRPQWTRPRRSRAAPGPLSSCTRSRSGRQGSSQDFEGFCGSLDRRFRSLSGFPSCYFACSDELTPWLAIWRLNFTICSTRVVISMVVDQILAHRETGEAGYWLCVSRSVAGILEVRSEGISNGEYGIKCNQYWELPSKWGFWTSFYEIAISSADVVSLKKNFFLPRVAPY
jgi:hypothetical protein